MKGLFQHGTCMWLQRGVGDPKWIGTSKPSEVSGCVMLSFGVIEPSTSGVLPILQLGIIFWGGKFDHNNWTSSDCKLTFYGSTKP